MSSRRSSSIRAFDHVTTGVSFIGLSLPPFVFGLILIVLVGTFYEKHFHSSTPLLPFLGGVYSPQTNGFDLADRIRHLILTGHCAVGSGDRDLQPLHAHGNARDVELRLPAHRACERHLGTARDFPSRVPQRTDPARRRSPPSTWAHSRAV